MDPFSGPVRGEHWLLLEAAPRVWSTTLWGQPTAVEMERLSECYAAVLERDGATPFVSIVDCRGLGNVDGAAFHTLASFMRARHDEFHRAMTRQAVVRPSGLVGAVVAGFYQMLEYTLPVRMFTDRARGLRWILGNGVAAAESRIARAVEEAHAEAPVVYELLQLFAGEPRLTLAEAARRLGRSPRNLQRELADADFRFVDLRARARVMRAQTLLVQSNHQLTAIAREVGCRSLQHFSRDFRARTGMSPSQWRRVQLSSGAK